MTTIAYRNGVMASDSLGERGNSKLPGQSRKLFRLKDGRIAATVGDYAPASRFVRWLDDGGQGDAPDLHQGTVIVLGTDRVLTVHECEGFYLEESDFCAWGSGIASALAAMHMGADPAKAVEIASLVDPYTGGEIVTMALECPPA